MTAVLPAPTMDATNADGRMPEELARPAGETDADRIDAASSPSCWLQEFRAGAWRIPGRYSMQPKVVVSLACNATTQAASHEHARHIALARMEALGFDPNEFTEFWDWPSGTLTFTHQSSPATTPAFDPTDQDRHTWDDLNTFPR